MELSDLEIFRAVVQAGGVIKAANRLYRVPSSVTTRVRQLERDLGSTLFIRERNRLRLSPAGETLLGYAEQMLRLQHEAVEALHDPEPRGTLRLGAMETTAAVRLPAVLSAFHRRYPDVHLELTTGSTQRLLSEVLNGDLEAAFIAGPIASPRIEVAPVAEEQVSIVAEAGHRKIRSPHDVAARSLLAFGPGCSYRRRAEEWFASVNLVPVRIIELASYQAILSCVAAGTGIALLPRSVLDFYAGRAHISLHAVPKDLRTVSVILVWRQGAGGARIRALLSVLKNVGSFPKGRSRAWTKHAATNEEERV